MTEEIKQQRYRYTGFGLTIASDIMLPELPVADGAAMVDVEIRLGAVAAKLADSLYSCVTFDLNNAELVLRVANIGRYHVVNGKTITVETAENAEDSGVRLFLLGTAMGVLLQQRGMLPIHGSSILTDEGAVIFTGQSGAGKSTMAAHFSEKGFAILNDDISVITFDEAGTALVHPGTTHLKLWADALDILKMDNSGLDRVRENFEKYFVRVDVQQQRPVPVREVILLQEKRENREENGVVSVDTLQAIRLLAANTYRPALINLSGRRNDHFKQCARLAKFSGVYRNVRPRGFEFIDETITQLTDRWRSAEPVDA